MSVLKSLTFTALPPVGANPMLDRRAKIITRLEEQKALASDPNFKRTIRRREVKDGTTMLVDKQQRILPWWRAAPNGSYALAVRLGNLVEFDKGKTAISVPTLDKLPSVIDTLISAIRNGELDAQLEAASVKPPKKAKK
jgi:hypothetical protein